MRFLTVEHSKSVTDIADHLHISLKATSRHLLLLDALDIVRGTGKAGHVFYSLEEKAPDDIKRVMKLFL